MLKNSFLNIILNRHWYITQGLPAVLGINLIPVLGAAIKILKRPKENKVGILLLVAVILHVAVHMYVT